MNADNRRLKKPRRLPRRSSAYSQEPAQQIRVNQRLSAAEIRNMKKIKVPRFTTEAEEAKWWDDHMNVVEGNLLELMKSGTAQRGGPRRVIQERRESKNITIRIALTDIERARALAAKKGIGYQTLMKMLLKEALDRESRVGPVRQRVKAP